MRFGIGVTTRNRASVLEESLARIRENTPEPYRLVVVSDASDDETSRMLERAATHDPALVPIESSERLGIARAKNRCLQALTGCDILFLFDDDCFPVKSGWASLYEQAIARTGVQHFNYHDPGRHRVLAETVRGGFTIREYQPPTGVLLVLSAKALETVGAFNERYEGYGFEHESYTNRCYRAGLHGGLGRNLSLHEATDYIRALDYETEIPSSVSTAEKRDALRRNRREALRDRREGAIYLPFENQPEPPPFVEAWWERLIPFGIRQAMVREEVR